MKTVIWSLLWEQSHFRFHTFTSVILSIFSIRYPKQCRVDWFDTIILIVISLHSVYCLKLSSQDHTDKMSSYIILWICQWGLDKILTENTPFDFLRMEKVVYCFSFLVLSNLEKSIFFDLLLRRKRTKDLGLSTKDPVRLLNHINLFCCTHH